ncbi:MAG: hypothetical protein IPN02_10195 [Candidatus Microthrix sp.]|uniref:Glycoside hydrolase family 38 central domain-containing protein n=1 Tax=Candidatus Neomicrothrix subdominans TaxID=2954438 RepID=A0A936NBD9_9ACTN|nr:hypothetical protein [Candidatus Microthrix subdominans]
MGERRRRWAPRRHLPVAEELTALWREVLTLQFHDILPGSSIAWVHHEAEESYQRIIGRCEEMIAVSLARIAGNAVSPWRRPTAGGSTVRVRTRSACCRPTLPHMFGPECRCGRLARRRDRPVPRRRAWPTGGLPSRRTSRPVAGRWPWPKRCRSGCNRDGPGSGATGADGSRATR